MKCDASTQTSELSDGEERRARTSRLKRDTCRARPSETNISSGPKPAAGKELSSMSPTDTSAAGPVGTADKHRLQAAWVLSRDSPLGVPKQAAQSSVAPEHVGITAASGAGSSCSSLPSPAAKGKEKEVFNFEGSFTDGGMSIGAEQHFRLQDQPGLSVSLGQPGAGAPSAPALGAAENNTTDNPFQEKAGPGQAAAGSCGAKVSTSAEPPAYDYSQVRREWEARFGPGKRAGGALLRKRSLEGPEPSESSTSGLSSASMPASGVSTSQLPAPSPGQLLGSKPASLAPTAAAIPRSASAESPGPSQGGASPAIRLALPARAALSEPSYQAPQQGLAVAAAPAVQPAPILDTPAAPVPGPYGDAVPDAPQARAPPLVGESPAPDAAPPSHAAESVAGIRSCAEPQHGAAQRSGSSSDVSVLLPPEAPDTATPSMSGDSFTDPGPPGDDSTFVTSRATSMACTLSPEEHPTPETPQGLSPSADMGSQILGSGRQIRVM